MMIKSSYKVIIYSSILIISIISLLVSSCITTNYYTGKTLEQGKTVLTPGVDNLVIIEQDEGIVDKDLSFSISLGIAHGFPWRFEAGIRNYFPYIWEANIRHQLNPRSFDWFDLSVNFHTGIVFSQRFEDVLPPYFKYGFTLSKEISTVQPFISYYLNNKFKFERVSERTDFRILAFGIAIKNRNDLIIPECSYYRSPSGDEFFSLGIGLRASLHRSTTKKER